MKKNNTNNNLNSSDNIFSSIFKVFSFNYVQTVKSKSFIISTLISLLVFMLFIPVSSGLKGNKKSVLSRDSSKVEKIYFLSDESKIGFDIDENDLNNFKNKYDLYKNVEIKILNNGENLKDYAKKESDSVLKKTLFVSVDVDPSKGYVIKVSKSKDSVIGVMEFEGFEDDFLEFFNKLKIDKNKIDAKWVEMAKKDVSLDISEIELVKEAKTHKYSKNLMEESFFCYIIFMVCIIIFIMAGESITSSIVTEKSTKVIEYLLVSTKPVILIAGKIFAAVCSVLTQMCLYAIAFMISYKIFAADDVNIIKGLHLDIFKENITVPGIIIAVLIIFVGICFYTTIAAIIGSTASRVEQLQETTQVYSFFSIVGVYLAMVLLMKSYTKSVFDIFILLCPLSSPYITPLFIITGKISLLFGLISFVTGLVVFLIFLKITSGLFEYLILYNGARLKFKDIIGLIKDNRKGGKKSE